MRNSKCKIKHHSKWLPRTLVLKWLKSHFTSNRVAMVQLILSNCRNIPTICLIDEPPTSVKVNVCYHISMNLVQSNSSQIFQIVGIFLHFWRYERSDKIVGIFLHFTFNSCSLFAFNGGNSTFKLSSIYKS